ncbi:transcriptional regulator [Nonomuraea sp. NPDC005983]|uniref:transcriptional regulator n=1 Tax=Nonomuraea sp. NPDC005983 TaxID=3155595 RepID=UPI0033B36794
MPDERPAWAIRLRNERRRRLWSQDDLAQEMEKAAKRNSRLSSSLPKRSSILRRIRDYEAGTHQPHDPYRILYCLVFDMDEAELFGNTPAQQGRTPADVLRELMRETDPLRRFPSHGGRQLGIGNISDLAARVHALRLADDVLAGGDLVQPAFREFNAAVRLYRTSTFTEDVGRSLLGAIGEFGQIAGWVASDAGMHKQATDAYRLGISAAREAGDKTLESNLIGSLAYQVSNIGDLEEAVALAYAALEVAGPHAPPRARALSWDRVAWAHARSGDAQMTVRALGEAETALAEHSDEDEPGYLYWVNAGELQVMEARAYTELRRPLRAVPILTDVLARYDATHTRELALYLSWLAVALADANEPEEAADAAVHMLDLSTDVASDRTAKRAQVVRARLEPYSDVSAVRKVLANQQWCA